MYRLIQVPLDGSSFAEQALPLAARLSQRDAAAMQVVHVHEPLAPIYRTLEAALNVDVMNDMRDYLDSTVKRLTDNLDFRADTVVLSGPAADTLARNAAETGADLFVMTTHGRGPMGRMWFGSVADALVRQSPIPILFVRPNGTSSDPHSAPAPKSILVPLDGSQLAEQALEQAIALGGGESDLTLLRVIPDVLPVTADPLSRRVSGLGASLLPQLQELKRRQEAEAHEYLGQVADRLRARAVKAQTQVIAHDHPALAILDAVSKRAADAIAMTTRGQSGIKRLLLGSVANKVVRGATTPVLIYPSVGASDMLNERS
jgi:nucleotide-binding universal stress UspA family protein